MEMKMKVMTFNIPHGQGIDGKVNLNRIAGIIEESEADLYRDFPLYPKNSISLETFVPD
ncbi:hypothetical protein PN4B1_00500 [Paenibacillus naphthalenovorans]|uniref:endonuclease/exonuclease/phosphatase family protein n=1 Tax=Paenibacillus naphthalenovorans TaxID=162209 RepID=UPI0010AFBF48|nr:hypothetical protein [Paenibacillus naphthalenovorans]GCL70150.1 hypothetical protein PN4B1_00500 [Paenibacillus naphthalenovorans]